MLHLWEPGLGAATDEALQLLALEHRGTRFARAPAAACAPLLRALRRPVGAWLVAARGGAVVGIAAAEEGADGGAAAGGAAADESSDFSDAETEVAWVRFLPCGNRVARVSVSASVLPVCYNQDAASRPAWPALRVRAGQQH